MNRFMHWLPRVLALAGAIFLSLLAFDVFGTEAGLGEELLGFLIHLAPTYVILTALVVAWRWELLGGVLFILLGLLFVLMFSDEEWLTFAITTVPSVVVGILFIVDWFRQRDEQPLAEG